MDGLAYLISFGVFVFVVGIFVLGKSDTAGTIVVLIGVVFFLVGLYIREDSHHTAVRNIEKTAQVETIDLSIDLNTVVYTRSGQFCVNEMVEVDEERFLADSELCLRLDNPTEVEIYDDGLRFRLGNEYCKLSPLPLLGVPETKLRCTEQGIWKSSES